MDTERSRVSETHDPRPIGVFDSGLGGLTAVRELFRVLPGERVVYFGDTARVPYGSKSRETVTRFSLEIARFLMRQDIKCLLVACNTSSSYALDTLKRQFDIPVVGVIDPAAGVAVTARRHGAPAGSEATPARIGVIGTQATIGSGAYAQALTRLAPGTHVASRACPLFVPLIEEGWLGHPVLRRVAEEYLGGMRDERLDGLILGCTHYPLIAPLLQDLVGPEVRLVDSGAEAALATAGLLRRRGLLAAADAGREPEHRFYLSDQRLDFERVARAFLGRDLPPTAIVDQTDLPWFERSIPH
jgi:glutamate racemase